MTQELIETSTSKKDIVLNSNALERLKKGLKINGGTKNALGYAKNFFSHKDQRKLMIEQKRKHNYTEVKNDKELNIEEINRLVNQIIGVSNEEQYVIEDQVSNGKQQVFEDQILNGKRQVIENQVG
jgi:hypothetical protein